MAVVTVKSLYGQGVVGQHVSCPWLNPAGPWEITQGYGPTAVPSEPIEDKQGKRQRWHSGVDIACSTNTMVVMPPDVLAKAVYLDNPGGYGFALILQVYASVTLAGQEIFTQRHADIYLGHLGARLVKNGQIVRPGDHVAMTDSSGNSTGPHLHFEVRPPDGRFGTDIDPSNYALTATQDGPGQSLGDALGASDPFGIKAAEQSLMNTVVGLAETALGGTMMLAGGVTIGFGLRGMSGKQALGVTRRTAGGLARRRSAYDLTRQRREEPVAVSAAGRTRLRGSLRREVPQTAAPAPTPMPGASAPRTRADARGLVPYEHGVRVSRARELQLRRGLPLKQAS